MNNPQPSAAPAATPTTNTPASPQSDVINVPTLEERAASVFSNNESPSEPAAEPGTGGSSPDQQPPGSTAGSGGDDAAKRAADRKARLEALQQQERQRVDAMQRNRQADQYRQRLDAAEKRAAEAERIAGQRFDPESMTEEQFFDIARRAKVTPQRLGEWMQERIANPEVAAQQAATRVLDPQLSALKKEIANQQAVISQFLQQQQAQAMAHQEAQALHEFAAYTEANAADAPYASNFLREFGREEFAALANSASANVPQGAGWQAVLDIIEDNLSSMAKIYASNGAQQRPAPAKPVPAGAKAPTTVSNALAQERASVVDEDANWGSLSFEERSARLFR